MHFLLADVYKTDAVLKATKKNWLDEMRSRKVRLNKMV